MTTSQTEEQAKLLADSYRETDASIEKILWFPNDDEIRILIVSPEMPHDASDHDVHPIYFRPSPIDHLPSPSAIAYIAPVEVEKLRLPADWGTWNDAVQL